MLWFAFANECGERIVLEHNTARMLAAWLEASGWRLCR